MEIKAVVEEVGLVGALRLATDLIRSATEHCPGWALAEDEVGVALGLAQEVSEAAAAVSAVAAGEAASRGLGSADGLSRVDWLRAQAPGLEGREAASLATVGAALHQPRWSVLADMVTRGVTPIGRAALIIRFDADLSRIADAEHLAAIVDAMVATSDVLSHRELARLATHGRACLRPPREVEDDEARHRAGRSLRRIGTTAGFVDYLLRLDPEAAAILEAALDPLARPRPDLDWGGDTTEDPRSPATRRADALLELINRAVGSPEGMTRTPRTQLVVTMTLEALLEQLRGAGVCDDDAVLSPAAVRRLACEATIIPTVLGARSEVLDLGRTERFFSRWQRRAMVLRDGCCTFPGCTVPPQWCDAHHVVHWCDGGATDLANGALLCGRHHTVVHARNLTASVTATGVTWHVRGARPAPAPTGAG